MLRSIPKRCFVHASAWQILLLGLLALSPIPSAHAGAENYFKNRTLDFMDIFSLRFGSAPRAHAAGLLVRATCVAQAGFVYFDGKTAGMDRRAFGVWRERRLQGALGPVAATSVEMKTLHGNEFADEDSDWSREDDRGIVRNSGYTYFWDDGREHPLAFGIELQPGILPGFEARFDPVELVDFIFGWVGMDIYKDDLREPPEEMSAVEHHKKTKPAKGPSRIEGKTDHPETLPLAPETGQEKKDENPSVILPRQ